MPELYAVLSSGLTGILSDLGIQITPRAPLFWMSDIIQPVALVNSQVPLNANIKQAAETFTSEGEQSVPAASTLFADTGQLVAGNRSFQIWISIRASTTNNLVMVQHRDADNTGTIWSYSFQHNAAVAAQNIIIPRFTLSLSENERVRVILSTTAATAGEFYQAAIIHRSES